MVNVVLEEDSKMLDDVRWYYGGLHEVGNPLAVATDRNIYQTSATPMASGVLIPDCR